MERLIHRTCTLCEACCGIEVRVEGERIRSIRGDERDPLSRGYICAKAPALKDLHEDPDRLRRPLRRRGDETRGRMSLKTRLEPSLAIRGGCALELNRENGRFYARLSCREYLFPADPAYNSAGGLMGKLSFTVGWETFSALPPGKREDV